MTDRQQGTGEVSAYRIISVGHGETATVGAPPSRASLETLEGRKRRIEHLLAQVRQRKAFLEPQGHGLERKVTAAVAAAKRKHACTSVVSLERYRGMFGGLCYAIRAEALAGLRQGIANGMMVPVPALLRSATGYEPTFANLFQPHVLETIRRAESWMHEHVGDIAPNAVFDGFAATLGFHLKALAGGSEEKAAMVAPFTELWLSGCIPVGLMSDQSFLVIVK
ncbi:MAG TPA: hypothetical protein VLC10_02925 [Patescibacteria group bacterium]|nr:hypothetical protein [Patescibacteria group bacterium]